MLRLVLRPVRLLAESLRGENSPHYFALGIALGMLAGLVPKDNLVAAVLGTLLLALRLNLGAATASALLFMWIGSFLDPVSHRLGHGVLSFGPFAPLFAWIFDLPLVPWTKLNNTVVLGNTIIGLVLAVPLYVISRRVFACVGPAMGERMEKYRVFQLLRVADAAAGRAT